MKGGNMHTSRESWLRAATDFLRSFFEAFGYVLPDKTRYSIAFTSRGKRGPVVGECWHPVASEDQHYEIIIRADIADPESVLGVLVHELVHTIMPPTEKHGRLFREAALRIGLEGMMRHALTIRKIACAVSLENPIGIDIEFWRTRDFTSLADYAFGPHEREEVAREGVSAFYRIWTLKEAIAKATGMGLFSILDGKDYVSDAMISGYSIRKDWQLFYKVPLLNYSLAIASGGSNDELSEVAFV